MWLSGLFLSAIMFGILSAGDIPNTKLAEHQNPIVTTPLGNVEGSILTSRLGRKIFAFRGLRYAKAPVGELRFKPPVPVEKWQGTYNATVDGSACPQPTNTPDEISEDCLFLNIYTTKLPNKGENPKRPVIIYFHPGGFYVLSGRSDIIGPQYLLDQDIVLVTNNYRLGSLGFISTGDALAPGNNGFKDQVEVLRWVNKNIASFGGDPDLVTISGYSAGGFSGGLHMMSPMSKGLFHRVIAMSGATTMQWEAQPHQFDLAQKTASLLGCPTDTSKKIIDCLKTKPATDIGNSLLGMVEFGTDPVLKWKPVIEPDFGQERFLTENPTVLVQSGRYYKVPYYAGITAYEFANLAYSLNDTMFSEMDQHFDRIAPISFLYERDTKRSKEISKSLRKFYFGNSTIDKSQIAPLGKLYGDSLISFGVDRMVHLVAATSDKPVYYYHFSYKGMLSHFYLPDTNFTVPLGPVHHDDLIYLFYNSRLFRMFQPTDPDVKTVVRLTTLWANFAKYGNPTPEKLTVLDNVTWEPFTLDNKKYLEIQCTLHMKHNLLRDRFNEWNKLFPLPTK